MTRYVLREDQRRFWRLVAEGVEFGPAATRLGLYPATGMRWAYQTGGVSPAYVRSQPVGRYLCLRERIQIQVGIDMDLSIREIARGLKRSASTVQREITRNMRRHYRARLHTRKDRFGKGKGRGPYGAVDAQRRADETTRGASAGRRGKLAQNPRLRQRVEDLIGEDFSPEQVAAQLKIELPHDVEMQVSHETIYKALYVQGNGQLRRDLHQRLRTGRALRKPRRVGGERRTRIKDMVNISERPPEVEDRAVPGHWEGDLILGSTASGSAIGTLVERTTRFVMLLHLPGRHGAGEVQDAMALAMAGLPHTLRKTLTWDQGIEMANHAQIAHATGLEIYFCDPHSPWQRGTNENTNGLLRQYFPKGSDLSVFPADYLDHVATKLNTRPRKTLDWQTPAQALDQLLSNPTDYPGVASPA